MLDIGLAFNSDLFEFDLVLEQNTQGYDLQGDNGLLTAVIISLFTDRRANADDELPDLRPGDPCSHADLRGWWGDHIFEEDARDLMGSRLWLLSREKDLDVVVARAEEYATEALRWLVHDRWVETVTATAERAQKGYLGIGVQATPPPGSNLLPRDWNFLYDYQNARPVKIETPGGV